MADPTDRNDLAPMTSGDTETASGSASFRQSAPLKNAGSNSTSGTADTLSSKASEAGETIKQGASDLRGQATDRVRLFAEDGKSKATDALGQLTQILNDAAAQVDDKLGKQYGQYARSAADQVQAFGTKLDDTTVDEIFDEARELVKKSPGVAVGIAAAVGFVVARLVSAGVEQRGA
ncbi:hypothetical protein SAMN05216382_0451 [Sphingomonas palmae]|uniref:Membrane-anchored ribosome-binding protein, inhibits growth in stationary phase, ElaB/YqjD/DUF883 family n=2 Tax=Sphingomonas palmae TaxID=1855283 RepID=A0A1H7H6E6_9SPHN|nr:hypothetical protein SAMN05216382_0451 [Sphingomonas palmae]